MLSKQVGMKRDSVGCRSERVKDAGNRMKRVVIAIVMMAKRTRSSMKKIVPIAVSPWKRCGVSEMMSAIPPVDMVSVYHA